MVATCSSETSVVFQRTTRRYIPEDIILHNHCYENLNYYIFLRIYDHKTSQSTYSDAVSNTLINNILKIVTISRHAK
jgi:hypothetical protein